MINRLANGPPSPREPKVPTPPTASPGPIRRAFSHFLGELRDVINPLQHIPVLSGLYRAVTKDGMSKTANVLGGLLYGGPIGAAAAMAQNVVNKIAGTDVLTAMWERVLPDKPAASAASQPQAVAASAAPAAPLAPHSGLPRKPSPPRAIPRELPTLVHHFGPATDSRLTRWRPAAGEQAKIAALKQLLPTNPPNITAQSLRDGKPWHHAAGEIWPAQGRVIDALPLAGSPKLAREPQARS
jgi:hypothetical protein